MLSSASTKQHVILFSCHDVEGGEVNFLHVPRWWQSFTNRDKTSVLQAPVAWLRLATSARCMPLAAVVGSHQFAHSDTVIPRGREGRTSVSVEQQTGKKQKMAMVHRNVPQ